MLMERNNENTGLWSSLKIEMGVMMMVVKLTVYLYNTT